MRFVVHVYPVQNGRFQAADENGRIRIFRPLQRAEIKTSTTRRVFKIAAMLPLIHNVLFFRPNYARYEKMLGNKVVHLKEIYKFEFDHFLIKSTFFVLIVKNTIKNSILSSN